MVGQRQVWHNICSIPLTGMGRCLIQIHSQIEESLMLKRVQQGFTLIELMIVIAIIGILAAIAIPAYQNYTIRAQVTEGLTLADGWKTAISEYYANTGNWPVLSNLTGNVASAGKYESVTVTTGGVILITYGGQANTKISGSTLSLEPYTNSNNDVLWQCGTATAPASGTAPASASVSNTISAQYLPVSCHS
jgi:type IV pilus assembly protein PilA